jgi:hypothetical protein
LSKTTPRTADDECLTAAAADDRDALAGELRRRAGVHVDGDEPRDPGRDALPEGDAVAEGVAVPGEHRSVRAAVGAAVGESCGRDGETREQRNDGSERAHGRGIGSRARESSLGRVP